MLRLRQSFSWWCFAGRGVETRELLSGAARIGFEAVEFIGEDLWPQVRDAGLAIAAAAGHGTIAQGLNRREHAGRIEQELHASLEKAVRWRIPVLVCFSGNRDGLKDAAGLDACAETLARILPAAEQAGVTLAMELLNSKVDHPDYQADHTLWGVELCRRLDSTSFKLLYDIYHMQIMEGDILRTIRDHHAHFAHYHTAGNPGRGPMDETQELRYPPIYRAIAEAGYGGYVGHEFLPNGNPLQALESAHQECVQALALAAS
jgi:hydroxypyruvate isomerase